ncbi:MAG: DUF2207 domain-containing protein [Bacteroidales bacterium]|nr:DUF2207 domain-containing protein [Bacteroidales bacterium]
MKRLIAILAAALVTLGAAAHTIRDLDITVELERDGSAWVTQRWDVDVTSENTEWYIPVENLGAMTVGSLSVSEDGQAFESLGDKWDVDRSRSWKTGKCGMVRKRDGAELCWGLGATGRHHWVVRFRLTGLVQAFDDADAFNFMFVTPGMNRPPEHAKVTIIPAFDCPEWTYDNTRVWAFGFYGDINVVDGKVVAESSESFSSSSKLIALVKFQQGLFQPEVVRGGAFQDFLDKALDGSSYGEDDGEKWFLAIFAFLFLGGLGLLIWAAIASALGYKWKKSLFGRTKIDGWYRDVPLEGNLHAAEYLLVKGKRFEVSAPANNIIGAFFLRWVMSGLVKVQPDPKSDKRVNLSFEAATSGGDDIEEDLFQMARSASGQNLILEKGEFEKWSTKNYKKLTAWPDRSVARGKLWFHDKGYFKKDGECTEEGARQACHVIEFQNFLKDFTLSGERAALEVKLWKDYLVYAQLFGIADKVAKQFKKLYPAAFDQLAKESGLDTTTLLYTMHWTNSMSTRAFNNAVSRAGNINGTGGHSSFGGGGGFSGGGFGGGGR